MKTNPTELRRALYYIRQGEEVIVANIEMANELVQYAAERDIRVTYYKRGNIYQAREEYETEAAE